MPTYCYTTDDGETVDRDFPMGEAPEFVFHNERRADRDYGAEHSGSRRAGGECWPMKPCFASGVNAAQAGELRKYLSDRGCPTAVTSEGDPVYTSPGHRTKALRLRGMHDNKGFN